MGGQSTWILRHCSCRTEVLWGAVLGNQVPHPHRHEFSKVMAACNPVMLALTELLSSFSPCWETLAVLCRQNSVHQ